MASEEAPHDIIGIVAKLPDTCWPGFEGATSETTITVVAYAPSITKYVVDTHDGCYYTFTYQELRAVSRSFCTQVGARAAAKGKKARKRCSL